MSDWSGYARLVVITMVPFVLASLGTMLAGRAGVFLVFQEGLMLASASTGFVIAHATGSLVAGLTGAMALGALFGLVVASGSVRLGLDQFVTGLALFLAGTGLSTLLPKLVQGVTLTPILVPTLPDVALPGLSALPFAGRVLFEHNVVVYASILLAGALWWLLYRTRWGLELRAAGESPVAADAAGIDVSWLRTVAAVAGGMMIALAGAYLPLAYTGTFTEGMVKGRGWLSIALAFFGGWRPLPIVGGAVFFAAVEVLAYRVQIGANAVPYQFVLMLPYLATLGVMALVGGRGETPGHLGRNYDRESRSG